MISDASPTKAASCFGRSTLTTPLANSAPKTPPTRPKRRESSPSCWPRSIDRGRGRSKGWPLFLRSRIGHNAAVFRGGLRHLFDWMVIGQVMPTNPAAAVRGPRHVVRRGKTPALDPAEARQLLDAIDTTTVIGLRDRALIGLMVYSFARIGAAIGMRVEDVYPQNRRLWVRLREKGGKRHAMPCHHNLESYLHVTPTRRSRRDSGFVVCRACSVAWR